MATTHGPLEGLRVLDCATILAAPLASQILGDFGADVIKIEHPERPDAMRGHGESVDGVGLWWTEVARNKRTLALDLRDAQGADVFRRLVRTADVLVENFRPGTLERWGLGWDELHALNPRLIMLRVTGFGQEGPYASRPAFGTLIEAMSGFAHMTGQPDAPPTLPAFGLADSIAGMAAVSAVLMALYHRDANGGDGQMIDLSLLEPILTAVGPAPSVYDKTGVVPVRQGNRSTNNAPRNLYRSRDGHWLAVSTSADSVARRVLTLVGHAEVIDEPWFARGSSRAQHADLLDEYVGGWIAQRDGDAVLEAFTDAGAAIAAVYSAKEIVDDPQVQSRDTLVRVAHPHLGDVLQHNVLFRLSETPGGIRFAGRDHGQDTDDILAELDIAAEDRDALRSRGVVR
ncbi:CaiB/BaiF CoA transferase family protein [Microbacterium sp. 179-I 3D2 NHS]|uniref:CaiB/BaiF CoA transferase family protein n=1 Tax=Microbacterium sp. 179-I 3D2 NHS TaxID=3235178 RepID=UPI0039A38D95